MRKVLHISQTISESFGVVNVKRYAREQKKTMSKDLLKKRLKLIPDRIVEGLNHKQKRVILNYQSDDKLNAVIRWPQRMAKARITAVEIANRMGTQPPRISEWINFKREPGEENYLEVESIIFNLGG